MSSYKIYARQVRKLGLPPLSEAEWQRQQDANEAANAAALEHSEAQTANEQHGRRQPRSRHRRPHTKPDGHQHAHAERGKDKRRRLRRKITQAERVGMPGEHVAYDPHQDPTAKAREERKLARAKQLGRHAPVGGEDVDAPAGNEKVQKRAKDVARRLGGGRRQ